MAGTEELRSAVVEQSEESIIALVKTATEGFPETDAGAHETVSGPGVIAENTSPGGPTGKSGSDGPVGGTSSNGPSESTSSSGPLGNVESGEPLSGVSSSNIPNFSDLLGLSEETKDPVKVLIEKGQNALTMDGPELPQDTKGASTKSGDMGSSAINYSYSCTYESSSSDQKSPESTTKSSDVKNVIHAGRYGISFSFPEESKEKNKAAEICMGDRDLPSQKGSEGTPAPAPAVHSLDQESNGRLMLKGYQQEVAETLLRGENGIVILPTGTGKTYVAIQVIIHHIKQRKDNQLAGKSNERCKIVFLVPTATLATQQLEKIEEFVNERCIRITGEDDTPLEKIKSLIKDDVHKVLVVTPAIINNYFNGCKEASIIDFTLLIFDECHHAKEGHQYNLLLERYYNESKGVSPDQSVKLPQLMGMTASLGIGDAKKEDKAKEFMLTMCARFHLKTPPTAVRDHSQELLETANNPDERTICIPGHKKDPFTEYLEIKIISALEKSVCEKVKRLSSTPEASKLEPFKFPTDRHHQSYEQYVTEMKDMMRNYLVVDTIKSDVNYIILALRHLGEYYRCLELVSLLQCKHGIEYLENMLQKPEYQGIDEIINLLQGKMEELQSLQVQVDGQNGNPKLVRLQQTLEELFTKKKDSKVIIFVRMRVVTKFMAEWLCSLDSNKYRATEFTSSGPSTRTGGMKPSALVDAREGFEGDKYNILVSTSVLEEGIDVQACNMVIRYMYSKDMIGKIQARGRARHKEGQIVIFADMKLLQQEDRNDFKEGLMHNALDSIQNMDVERFKSEVNNLRKHPFLLFPTKMESTNKPKLSNGIVKCSLCGSDLGNIQDIKCFLKSHYLVLDSSISQKVVSYPKEFSMKSMDGIIPHSLLHCSAKKENGKMCSNQVGTLLKMRYTGCYFGMWSIKEIQVDKRKFKKYQDMKEVYIIDEIFIEDLQSLAPEKQFPRDHLLE